MASERTVAFVYRKSRFLVSPLRPPGDLGEKTAEPLAEQTWHSDGAGLGLSSTLEQVFGKSLFPVSSSSINLSPRLFVQAGFWVERRHHQLLIMQMFQGDLEVTAFIQLHQLWGEKRCTWRLWKAARWIRSVVQTVWASLLPDVPSSWMKTPLSKR